MTPKLAAAEVLRSVRLDVGANMRLVAKRLGVRVFSCPRSERWDEIGQTALVGTEVRIYLVDLLLAPERFAELQAVVAHEIGHVICRRWNIDAGDHEEKWCNDFSDAMTGIESAKLGWLDALSETIANATTLREQGAA